MKHGLWQRNTEVEEHCACMYLLLSSQKKCLSGGGGGGFRCATFLFVNVGINTFITIMLLALTTTCGGGALLTTQVTHMCPILSFILRLGSRTELQTPPPPRAWGLVWNIWRGSPDELHQPVRVLLHFTQCLHSQVGPSPSLWTMGPCFWTDTSNSAANAPRRRGSSGRF